MTEFELFLILSGFLIGSAIDAAADRIQRGRSWALPRSRCNSCNKPLRWFDLIPVLSWAVSRGRCRHCRAPIGWSAPVSETAGALIAASAILMQSGDAALLMLTVVFGWLLLTLAAIDFRTFILPDKLNLLVFGLGWVMVTLSEREAFLLHLAGGMAGYGFLRLVEFAYEKIRGQPGLGRGDAKLLGAIGVWVGIDGIAPVLLVASLCGIGHVLARSAITGSAISRQTTIPFGPWIALAGYGVFLFPPL